MDAIYDTDKTDEEVKQWLLKYYDGCKAVADEAGIKTFLDKLYTNWLIKTSITLD